jgi:hypothetical protein
MVAYSGEKCGRIPTKFNPSTPPSSTPAHPRHLVISQKRARYLTVGLLIASMLATLLLFLNCFVDWSPKLTVNQLLEHYNNSIAILCGSSLVLQFIAFVVIASNRSS